MLPIRPPSWSSPATLAAPIRVYGTCLLVCPTAPTWFRLVSWFAWCATWRRTRPNCVLRDLFRRTPLNRLGARQLLGRGCFATFDTEPRSASWHTTIRFRVEQLLGEVRT